MADIADFFGGKVVLITGATGFMGKVLVEKLLRSCPDVEKLYVLMRPKRSNSVNERREELLRAKIFEGLKQSRPEQLKKLVAVAGDIMQPHLGLSTQDRTMLQDEVHVVFHSAATVKFTEVLKISVDMNVRGVLSLLSLAKKMKHLQAFIHVSTAYCNCDRPVVEEMVYPSPADPHKVMQTLDWLDDHLVADITPKLLGDRPNTYTYTKAMAESLIESERGDLPIAIVRPSIVTCAWREPVPGWIDNFNGPSGIIAGIGKGVMRTLQCDGSLVADIVPVDIPINLMIAAAWHQATHRPRDLIVYNCASGTINPIRWGQFLTWGLRELRTSPMDGVFWYPNGGFVKSGLLNTFWLATCQFLPAYLIDVVTIALGKKPGMVKMQHKMQAACACLAFFTTNEWQFKTTNVPELFNRMSKRDRNEFNFDMTEIEWESYIATYCNGVGKYILKGSDNRDKARKELRVLFMLYQSSRLVMFVMTWRYMSGRLGPLRSLLTAILELIRRLLIYRYPSRLRLPRS